LNVAKLWNCKGGMTSWKF